jgi:hypothetical protein
MVGQPWTFAFYEKDEPCAVAYMEPLGDLRWRTHFVATEEGFKKIWMPVTIFMKKLSDQLVKDGGIIEAYSWKAARKWFQVLGFKLFVSYDKIDKHVKFDKLQVAIGHCSGKRGVLCAETVPKK